MKLVILSLIIIHTAFAMPDCRDYDQPIADIANQIRALDDLASQTVDRRARAELRHRAASLQTQHDALVVKRLECIFDR